jgi:hypothetical protein
LASLLLEEVVMKAQTTVLADRKPRMIAERQPLQPVRIAAIRPPIKVTKPISFGRSALVPLRQSP